MKNKKGFTLIELLVVIAIIGLLSTLAVVTLSSARQKARDARRKSDLKQISTAMELYYSENESYPTNNAAGCTTGAADQVAGADVAGALENLCSGDGMGISDGTNTYLAVMPGDPTSGQSYQYEGDTTTYCISATLEAGGYFVCSNGSCYESGNNCTAS